VYDRVGSCDTTNCICVLHTYIIACIYIYIYIYTQYLYMHTLHAYIMYMFRYIKYILYIPCIYIHTYTYIHTYIRTYIHSYIHTCTHAAVYAKMHSLNSSSMTGASSTHISPCVGLLLVGQQLVRSEWSV